MSRQSSPDFTPRTATLLRGALERIEDGETVVDLGAGRDAGVARAVKAARPRCRVIAVEPNVPIDPAVGSEIETVAGTLDALGDFAVDTILFNSPNTPDRFVDRSDRSWHQFAGGPRGYDCLHGVVAASLERVRAGGKVIFICPTFSPPPPARRPLELLATYDEPLVPFRERAAVLDDLRPEYARFLESRLLELAPAWAALGVSVAPDSVTAAVLCANA